MVARDPEAAVRWIVVALLAALVVVLVPIIVWELVWQRGEDNGVTTGVGILLAFIAAGPVGIKVTRFGKDD